MANGATVGLEQVWTLARLWYGHRLDPDWRRPTPAEAAAMFREAGLAGGFWDLDAPVVE
jgi:hypothetical protein